MEKYDLLNKLEDMATANGWVFLAGDNFYQNYESVMHEYEPGQCILGVDFVASDVYNDYGVLTGINYIGSIRLGRKVDADTITASLDETFKQKHDRRLQDLKVLLSNALSDLACENQLQITNSVGILEINKFDANIDFVGLQITFNQQDFGIELPTYYPLNISTGTGGAIQPTSGTYSYLKNTIVPIVAIANSGYRFANWVINGVNDVKNLTTVTMSQAVTAIASFDYIGVLIEKLKTFTTPPTPRGNAYYFGDHSTEDNDVLIKNETVGQPDGVNDYCQFAQPFTWFNTTTNQWTIEFEVDLKALNRSYAMILSNGTSAANDVFYIAFNQNNIIVRIRKINTNELVKGCYTILGKQKITITYNGSRLASGLHIYVNGFENILSTLIDTLTSDINNTANWVMHGNGNTYNLNPVYTLRAWKSVQPLNTTVAPDLMDFVFNQGDAAIIPDLIPNSTNYITIYNAVLSTFWSGRINGVEPIWATRGATLYRNDSTGKIMVICMQTNAIYTGYTRIGYFPPASGALKGLPNTYTLVGNSEVPAGDYTADQIAAFVNSDLVQVTQNDNAVTQLILKQ